MTDTLRFPWDGDQDAQRREVAPSVFRPRRSRASAAADALPCLSPQSAPDRSRARAASVAGQLGGRHGAHSRIRDEAPGMPRARSRATACPGRVVQGPQRERHEPDYLVLLAAVALSAIGILMVYSSTRRWTRPAMAASSTAVTTQLTWALVGRHRARGRDAHGLSLLAGASPCSASPSPWGCWSSCSCQPSRRSSSPSRPTAPRAGCASAACRPSTPPSSPSWRSSSTWPTGWPRAVRRWAASGAACCPSWPSSASLAILVVLEPDLGTTGVIVLTGFTMFFVAGGSLWQLLLMSRWASPGWAPCCS